MTLVDNSMTREELHELAALDVYGLLDEYEAALYTRSFHNATAAVQANTGMAAAEPVIPPDAEPDPTLRDRVLETVARAAEREASQLSPLAVIRPTRAQRHDDAAPRYVSGGSNYWRAAAFALAAGLLVITFFYATAQRKNDEITRLALTQGLWNAHDSVLGPTFRQIAGHPNTRTLMLVDRQTVDDAAVERWAAVYVNERTGAAFVVVHGLRNAGNRPYTLTVTGNDGDTLHRHAFVTPPRMARVQLPPAHLETLVPARWSVTDADGRTIEFTVA